MGKGKNFMVSSFSCGSWCCLPPDLNILTQRHSWVMLTDWTQGNALRKGHSSDSFVKMTGLCVLPSLTIYPCFLTEVSCHSVNWPTEMPVKRTESSIQWPAGNWRLLQTTLEVSKRTFYNWILLSDNPSWHLVQNPKPEEQVSINSDPGPEVNYYRTCEYICFHVWQHTIFWILYCTVVGFIHLSGWKEKLLDNVGNGSEDLFEMILRQGINTCNICTQQADIGGTWVQTKPKLHRTGTKAGGRRRLLLLSYCQTGGHTLGSTKANILRSTKKPMS